MMMQSGTKWVLPIVALIGLAAETSSTQTLRLAAARSGQGAVAPVNDLPNPYEAVKNWGTLPDGRMWGSTGAINIDRDGTSIWAVERCGSHSWQAAGGSCAGSNLPAVLKFDASGKLQRAIGGGVFIFPHGVHVDRDGNVWVADSRGPTEEELAKFPDARSKGHRVVKFSPDGKILLTLGKGGVAGNPPEHLNEPCDIITLPNGDILVAEGHSGQNTKPRPDTVSRLSQFSKDGRFIKTWGRLGSGPGEFKTPHALALDSQGRLFVADRGNNRVQIFDREGKYLDSWSQFGRPSDVHIDKHGILYVADSESGPRYYPGWRRGVRIARVSDGRVTYLIHPHQTDRPEGMSGEGVTVDAQGNVYSSEVGTDGGPLAVRGITKYIARSPIFR